MKLYNSEAVNHKELAGRKAKKTKTFYQTSQMKIENKVGKRSELALQTNLTDKCPVPCISKCIYASMTCFYRIEESVVFFPLRGQIVNIFSFVGYMVSLANTQLCLCSLKAAITIHK